MAALKLKADDIAAHYEASRQVRPTDSLTLPNVSFLYRYSLLAKILHVRVPLLQDVVDLFGDPFKSAWDTLALLETWGKMEDAGFTFRQLDYLILGRDDPLRPLGSVTEDHPATHQDTLRWIECHRSRPSRT